MFFYSFFFFFQAEDGIRDHCVTGVQTYALPISERRVSPDPGRPVRLLRRIAGPRVGSGDAVRRSEERRVGKECGCRGWACDVEKRNGEIGEGCWCVVSE